MHHEPPSAALHENARPDDPAVPAREVWRLVGPWLGYLVLGAAGIFGLFTASASADAATYDAGLIAFAIAVVLIAVRMKRQFDGTEAGFLLPISPAGADTLFVTVAILAVLGLVGAVLAAAVGGMLYGIGLALFIVCAALIFIEVKRYFDRLDRGL